MYRDFTYEAVLGSSLRAAWRLDDVLAVDQQLDFSRDFLPDRLAGCAILAGLSRDEQRLLNQITAHQYLSFFGIIEEFILPFVLDHARSMLRDDDYRVRALLNFAGEEAKHIQMFKRFHAAFERGFPVPCQVIGPPEAIGAEVLKHDPLAVALVILMIEWMTQAHYLESVHGDPDLDPLFKSLLRHHWMEEAQHAKLDTLMVEAIADGRSAAEIEGAIDDVFAIAAFFDAGLETQAQLNVDAFEAAIGHRRHDRAALIARQHQAARWTYLGSGLVHPQFRATLEQVSPAGAARIGAAAPQFA